MRTFREFLEDQGWTADYFGGKPSDFFPVGDEPAQPMEKSFMSISAKEKYWAIKLSATKGIIRNVLERIAFQHPLHQKIANMIVDRLVKEINKIKGNYRPNSEPRSANSLGILNKDGWKEAVNPQAEFDQVKNYVIGVLKQLSGYNNHMGVTKDKDVMRLRMQIAKHLLEKIGTYRLK